ncbi:SMC-Scp complex subunit ScpB [Nitrosomonas mobilis]|uniref:Segregation and condensation protein B homolog n=1 Tax=Nitrosomonas mobilis TaxID=51642 RepID=A0A1G5SET8_9PROT|nr:SMC-Scp complex subunit ScpB [Nitrosomonas mobilis]SCZ85487.1 Segregation and condensation protein B homolog [Nitrosomonas mobilis]HNO74540.1 SMC-Scp complex subunit ScpB [Nitrosomonas mobilis]
MSAPPSLTQSTEAIKILETALLTSSTPLSLDQLRKLFDNKTTHRDLSGLLRLLAETWQDRGLILVEIASGWRFQSKPEMQVFLEKLNPQSPPRYSRAVMETLAIIAYRQPVTRGDIEAIRGVAVSTTIIKTLESRRWIESVGQREVPGRPLLYATTEYFLDDFNLQDLEQLPPLENMEQFENNTVMQLIDAQNITNHICGHINNQP